MSDDELADVEVQILRAQPGDVVVVTPGKPLDPHRLAEQVKQLKAILPAGVRAMVLVAGWRVDLIPGDEVSSMRDLARLLESEGGEDR